ncbi:MAG: molybdate ABC transporter substrate-binding protein [Verrucomicrobia bacterium]|nr:molybdate ABC transporter substrate-binding protein [Verrucomicrobiota bacterium]
MIVPARTETLTVAAAADLTYCLPEVDQAFQGQHAGVEVRLSTGSSGNFFAQIQNGAPFDVFLSADLHYPQELIKSGDAIPDSVFIYGSGRLVLWTNKPQAVDLTRGLEALRDTRTVQKVAIANPEHAPYGRAAKAALQKAGLWDEIQPRLVVGENIAQTLQYVETQNADVGLVALALVLSPRLGGTGKYAEVDDRLYPPLNQAAVITRHGSEKAVAKAYLEFLRSTAARGIFDKYGFKPPVGDQPNSPR